MVHKPTDITSLIRLVYSNINLDKERKVRVEFLIRLQISSMESSEYFENIDISYFSLIIYRKGG